MSDACGVRPWVAIDDEWTAKRSLVNFRATNIGRHPILEPHIRVLWAESTNAQTTRKVLVDTRFLANNIRNFRLQIFAGPTRRGVWRNVAISVNADQLQQI